MEAIARYTESHLQVRRVFALYADRVEIHAKWLLGGQYKSRVLLATLAPDFQQIWVRYRWFKHAILAFAIGIGISALAGHAAESMHKAFVLLGAIVGAAGLVIGMFTARKVPFARFVSTDGKPKLDIARAGPDKQNFEGFVRQVQRQIRKAGGKG